VTVLVDTVLEPPASLGTGAFVAANPRMELGTLAPLKLEATRQMLVATQPRESASYSAVMRAVQVASNSYRHDFPAFYFPIASLAPDLPAAHPELARVLLDRLAGELEHDTAHLSVARRASRHPAFQELAKLGPIGTRVALRRLARSPSPVWLYFLQHVTGERPAASTSSVDEAVRLWREWGKQRGLA